jgi:hypothetical protein
VNASTTFTMLDSNSGESLGVFESKIFAEKCFEFATLICDRHKTVRVGCKIIAGFANAQYRRKAEPLKANAGVVRGIAPVFACGYLT